MCNANVVRFNPSCRLSMPAVAVQMNVFRRVTGLLTYQRAIPVMSDGCTSCILHWLAVSVYQKCTLLKVYYIETEKPWNLTGPSAPPFWYVKGKHLTAHIFFCSHRCFLKDLFHQSTGKKKTCQHRNWSHIWILNLETPIFSQWKPSTVRITEDERKGTYSYLSDICTE